MDDIYKGTCYTKTEINDKKSKTSVKNYGVTHPMKSSEVKEKLKDVFIEKYGVDNPSKNPEVIEKIRQISLEKYGVDNPSKNPEVIEKIREKARERWNNPEYKASMLEKRKRTNLEKFGVEWNSQRTEHQELSKKTNLERYGTEWAMQNDVIHDKSTKNSKLLKEYIFPSGNIEKIQGYENLALDYLLKSYREEEMVLQRGKKPRIKYQFDGKDRIYKPDIYVPKENLVIEVKSTYTYQKELQKNLAKQAACQQQGYKFKFMIFDKKGNLIDN